MDSFWEKIAKKKKVFFCMAPMYDVTDSAFRIMVAKYGGADILFTEFVSADGLMSEGREKLLHLLKFSKEEKPIVAQIFGSNPKTIETACRFVVGLGFDGIDINMGCPEKNILKSGAGAELINDPKLARKIICSAKKGAGKIPVSVKTRIGYNKNEIEKWVPEILKEEPTALTIHARTKKEMSKVPADWSNIKRAVEIRNELKSPTLIIGNGDVKNREEGEERAQETGCDGIMIGRGFFGKPWLMSDFKPTLKERLNILVEHTKLFEKLLGKEKNFAVMKKHFKAYCTGFTGAKELRIKLMETNSAKEVEEIVNKFLISNI